MKVTTYPDAYERHHFTQLPQAAGRVILAMPKHDTEVIDGDPAPRIWINLDNDAMEACAGQTVCTAVVKFPGNKTAVAHFSIKVRDGKVTACVTSGGKKRDVERNVSVPVWERDHVAGKNIG